MHIDIPEDLHTRLRHLAQDTGQDLDELLREAIEARLAMQEQAGPPGAMRGKFTVSKRAAPMSSTTRYHFI